MSLMTTINSIMHEGSTCPGAGSLGECCAIWLHASGESLGYYSAAVYLWPPAADTLTYAEVARWFKEATGDQEVQVIAIMHEECNETLEGRCSDGARPLTVSFSLTSEKAEELGLPAPELTPKPAEDSTRLSASELLGVRNVAPRITAEQCEEVATLQVQQLQTRLLCSFDLDRRHQNALAQIADMDPQGMRADDLGRAARIARAALGSQEQRQ